MTLKRLFEDEDAVSPVIGVILMVAITVILAAVIGTFVLGLGDQVQQNAPTASVTFAQDGAANDDEATIKINHDSGKSLNHDNIKILVDGSSLDGAAEAWANSGGDESTITAGESITIEEGGDAEYDPGTDLEPGSTVSVVWTSDDGSTSDTLQEYTVS